MEMMLKNVQCLYTQMLNGKRINEHDVVYVFDEVGCGKTVSAIIAMANVIKNKPEGCKILVLTPVSVCPQFAEEIKNKLRNSELAIKDLSGYVGEKLTAEINDIKKSTSVIAVSNPHKASKLSNIEWDLVIIDEAHDIVCNNKKQTDIYYNGKIDEAYKRYCALKDYKADRIEKVKKYVDKIPDEDMYIYVKNFIKHLAVDEYNNFVEIRDHWDKYTEIINLAPTRYNDTHIFSGVCQLSSKKVMFLTATPYKNSKDLDFLNYALMATRIIRKDMLFLPSYLPQISWIEDIYTGNINQETVKSMENSNASFMFKEIALGIPANFQMKEVTGKMRKIQIWKESESPLSEWINNALHTTNTRKNRIIIFVANSREGKYIFDKLFPNTNLDIIKTIEKNSKYIHEDKEIYDMPIRCKFVMNKFGNSNLNIYSEENSDIPDILIVTWQVAQVGVNLPTFNYVVNYNISPIPGYLEQRYGRIDRLDSKNDPLYNVYYLDNQPGSYIYYSNLIRALYRYKKEILDIPHNMPVKNLLLCKELQFDKIEVGSLYNDLAFYVYGYLSEKPAEEESANSIDDIKKYLEGCSEWKGKDIKIDSTSSNCLMIGDKAIAIKCINEFDEKNDNSAIEADTNKGNIKALCERIAKCEEENKNVEELNKLDKLGDAGSIIYVNSENNEVVIESRTIVERIIKIKIGEGK